jgi:2,3-bisphosphoglycerate-dependent phosphoglycerate mutase
LTEEFRQYRYTVPPGATDLIIVRHGESAPWRSDVEVPQWNGHGDPALAPEGREQARLLADRLQHEQIDGIYVSSLRRTSETIAPLAERLGITPVVEPDLREVYLGEWEDEGKFRRYTSQGHELALQMFAEQRWDVIPGAESTADFTTRLRRGISRIAEAHPDQRVVVVVHGGVIGALLSMATGSEGFAFISADNASISEIVVHRDRWIVRRFNEICHLTPALPDPTTV